LNLTAAEYVFLLDRWWNPGVEAQAVDCAHRIGQTRQVFAYRLITRDTVEEKVLELQKTKRDLAGRDHRRGQQPDPESASGRPRTPALVAGNSQRQMQISATRGLTTVTMFAAR